MPLPVKTDSRYYQFYKTLHEDVKLSSNEYGEWDVVFKDDDWVNCTGIDSISNACIIAIMTRFQELDYSTLYEDFGCRIHELTKTNKGRHTVYEMEIFITEVLNSMRRVKTVNWVEITENPDNQYYNYRINFSITTISDEDDDAEGELIEESITV